MSRLAELIGTLSLATDAGTGAPEEMGLRSAIASAKLAAAAGVSAREQSDAYYLALLRYTGCTSEGDLAHAMFGDEIEFGVENFGADYGDAKVVMGAVMRNARKRGGVLAMAKVLTQMPKMPGVMRAHCEVADLLARRFGFDEAFRTALVQNNERWNGSGMPNKLKGDAIALPMRLAHVGQDIAIGFKLGGVDGARARVTNHAKKGLDPALVAKVTDEVIASLDVPSIWAAFLDAEPRPHRELGAGTTTKRSSRPATRSCTPVTSRARRRASSRGSPRLTRRSGFRTPVL